jgi:putative toxin-antitoxin system antitoxin component (TIGR02293 family)
MKNYIIEDYQNMIANEPTLVYNARSGMMPQIFNDLFEITGFNKEELSDYFNTSWKTISRYLVANKPLDAVISEHALRMISIYQKGFEIFEDLEVFRNWLDKENYGTAGIKPKELLKTPGGLQLVKEELFRIEFGATA